MLISWLGEEWLRWAAMQFYYARHVFENDS